jgi:pSer/pThr/pTyr-binding forkhead associated (FHA) protein
MKTDGSKPFSLFLSYVGKKKEFFKEFASPVLLIRSNDNANNDLINTPSSAEAPSSYKKTVQSKKSGFFFRTGRPELAQTKVILLQKTNRNPFKSMITFGRALNNDIIILNKLVSKIHAIFCQKESMWFIEDRNSANGTTLCGVHLIPNERYPLKDEDEIVFGNTVIGQFLTPQSFWDLLQSLEKDDRTRPKY